MSNLTIEKLRAIMATLPKPEPGLFDLNPFRMPKFAGLNVYEAPPPPPKVQVRQLFLKDGTALLPAKFLAETNAALLDRFGHRDDPFKDKIYLLGSYGIVMSSDHRRIIGDMCS